MSYYGTHGSEDGGRGVGKQLLGDFKEIFINMCWAHMGAHKNENFKLSQDMSCPVSENIVILGGRVANYPGCHGPTYSHKRNV